MATNLFGRDGDRWLSCNVERSADDSLFLAWWSLSHCLTTDSIILWLGIENWEDDESLTKVRHSRYIKAWRAASLVGQMSIWLSGLRWACDARE